MMVLTELALQMGRKGILQRLDNWATPNKLNQKIERREKSVKLPQRR